MRKLFFYILSFILTVAVAISGSAIAFSSDLKENGPRFEVKTEKIKNPIVKTDTVTLANSYEKQTQTYTAPVQTPAPAPTSAPAPIDNTPVFNVTDYISICDNVNCFTSKDAERGIVQFQNTFFYGHSTIAFNRLKTVYVGNEIIVKDINGVSHRYRITERMVKSKAYLNGDGKLDGFTAGIYAAKYNGIKYSAAFMTCGNGGNDDSNYRLILFAVEV